MDIRKHTQRRSIARHTPSGHAGAVVVHNHVRHRANTRNGTNGFRYWFEPPSEKLVICHCGWRPKDPPHFQIRARFATKEIGHG